MSMSEVWSVGFNNSTCRTVETSSGQLWQRQPLVCAGRGARRGGTMTATAILLKQKKDREEKRKEEEK